MRKRASRLCWTRKRKRHFDLSAAPPVSFKLLRLRSDCHVLLRSARPHRYGRTLMEYFLAGLGSYLRRAFARQASLASTACYSIRRLLSFEAADLWGRGGKPLHQAAAWWRRELEAVPRPPNPDGSRLTCGGNRRGSSTPMTGASPGASNWTPRGGWTAWAERSMQLILPSA